MPRRATPGDEAAIRAALSPTLAAALDELRELLDIVDFQQTTLGPPFQCAAAVLLAADLCRAGAAPGEALHEAADRLGLERETVRSWARRWSAASRVQHARAERRATGANLVRELADLPPDSRKAA